MKNKVPDDATDYDLWQRFKMGDKQAFIKIYKDNYPPLFTYGIRIKNDHELVKDCIQEMFFDIMSHIEHLGDINNILCYLITSLRRKIFRKIQHELAFYSDKSLYLQDFQLMDEDSSDDELFGLDIRRNRKLQMRRLIDHLPPRQKEALLMKFYLRLEYKDIAAIMGLNIQSVRNLIHKAIKTLRERIKEVPALSQPA